ncbi:hypothetical protein DE146DRAFT_317876 [Phaeosphaeria sp. MPI-PUGE-AT-0046c]|nr:hypothetical protein DE146DRAFT_317876 [Phaeosphaeria sp. MPI-PUGE-AT-0046c]
MANLANVGMANTAIHILSLPAEIRLEIGAHVFRQTGNPLLVDSASFNLRPLLVCRQFYREFADLAYHLTTFTFCEQTMQNVQQMPDPKLRHIKRVVIAAEISKLDDWQMYPFNKEHLLLDELCLRPTNMLGRKNGMTNLIDLLWRLQHVKMLRVFSNFEHLKFPDTHFKGAYGVLVGSMYKEDHYRRYDAPDALTAKHTWWEPHLNAGDSSYDFVPCQPVLVMPEDDYLLMMKPKIDKLMDWIDTL